MSNKKVAIVMSTYNGEKYVAEQIESLLNQTYKNIDIFIRDDGSTDKTLEILHKYKDDGKIKLFLGENIGFIDSFYFILNEAKKYDYYAFCDQDDVWNEDKIENAVNAMQNSKPDIATMYFSRYDFYDENMNFKERGPIFKKGPSFRNSLVDCISLGISILINNKAKEIILATGRENTCGHDWWAYIVCSAVGKVIYDKKATVKYRRTGNNVSPGGNNFIKLQIYRIKKLLFNDYFKNISLQFIQIKEYFYKDLTEDKKEILDMFTQKSFKNYIKKIFYPKMFRQNIIDEILLRIIFLLGKL
ncbi:MAG: glycosyltransferase family 2 protein [Candidatus Scatovivens sp.]